jgi:hypothetical protein
VIGTRADPVFLDEEVDAAERVRVSFCHLVGRGVAGQVGLNGEQVVRLVLLTASASGGSRSLSTPATRMPAVNRARVIALPIPPAAPVTIATRRVSVMACFPASRPDARVAQSLPPS